MDKETIIKGLECCFNPHSENSILCRCADCPYNPPEEKDWDVQCQIKLNRDVLALLQELEAIEPILRLGGDGIFVWTCGSCGAHMYCNIDDKIDKAKEYAKYCRQCGKAVKWK